MKLEALEDIIKGMENREMIVYYQPQYDALTSELTGAEALVRWRKPDGSIVAPGAFIPVLEETDYIIDLDWCVLKQVCTFLQKRIEAGLKCVPIAVNFSRRHFSKPDFRETLLGIIDNFALPHNLIDIEITESAVMENSDEMVDYMIKLIAELRHDGFNVAIDDFGSGLSSLSLIKDISANILKIDRSLLSDNCEKEKERILLESIFDFAHRLKFTTIAEGVETNKQLGFLRTCDCRIIQGFLFNKPMPEEAFSEICENHTKANDADILAIQSTSGATQLLLQAIFTRYPLIILSNLTRNSYYMMVYENFSSQQCDASGSFDELICHGASTMLLEEQELFATTFSIPSLMDAYKKGEKSVTLVTHQIGDDGIYRKVETTDYFVKNPSSDDVLVITLCQNL